MERSALFCESFPFLVTSRNDFGRCHPVFWELLQCVERDLAPVGEASRITKSSFKIYKGKTFRRQNPMRTRYWEGKGGSRTSLVCNAASAGIFSGIYASFLADTVAISDKR